MSLYFLLNSHNNLLKNVFGLVFSINHINNLTTEKKVCGLQVKDAFKVFFSWLKVFVLSFQQFLIENMNVLLF